MTQLNRKTKTVFQNGIHPKVANLNFDNLKFKLTKPSEAEMTLEKFLLAEQEYRRFLSLKKMYPNIDLVPSKLIDTFWHAHILDTKAYREDCQNVFGYFLDHYPYFGIKDSKDYKKLQSSFERTKKLYEHHYGKYPKLGNSAARCQDHACHAPTSCACRTPGACK